MDPMGKGFRELKSHDSNLKAQLPGPEARSWNQWEFDLQKTSEQYSRYQTSQYHVYKNKKYLYIYINK